MRGGDEWGPGRRQPLILVPLPQCSWRGTLPTPGPHACRIPHATGTRGVRPHATPLSRPNYPRAHQGASQDSHFLVSPGFSGLSPNRFPAGVLCPASKKLPLACPPRSFRCLAVAAEARASSDIVERRAGLNPPHPASSPLSYKITSPLILK